MKLYVAYFIAWVILLSSCKSRKLQIDTSNRVESVNSVDSSRTREASTTVRKDSSITTTQTSDSVEVKIVEDFTKNTRTTTLKYKRDQLKKEQKAIQETKEELKDSVGVERKKLDIKESGKKKTLEATKEKPTWIVWLVVLLILVGGAMWVVKRKNS